MNKNKETYYVSCLNMYHLLGLHLVDALGAYNHELCPDVPPSSILHHPREGMSSHSLGAKPGYTVMSFCQTAHVHWRVTAGSHTAVVWLAEVE